MKCLILILALVTLSACSPNPEGTSQSPKEANLNNLVDAESQILYNPDHIGTYSFAQPEYGVVHRLHIYSEGKFTLEMCVTNQPCLQHFSGHNLSEMETKREGYLNYIYKKTASITFGRDTYFYTKISDTVLEGKK